MEEKYDNLHALSIAIVALVSLAAEDIDSPYSKSLTHHAMILDQIRRKIVDDIRRTEVKT